MQLVVFISSAQSPPEPLNSRCVTIPLPPQEAGD